MRKATGVVRKVDDLGRVVLPIELRRLLGINEGDSMEIFVNDKEEIILHKYQPGCVLCGGVVEEGPDTLFYVYGRPVCKECCVICGDAVEITPRIMEAAKG